MKPNNVIVFVLMMLLILGFIGFYLGGFLFGRYHLWVRPGLDRTYDLEQAAQAAPGRAPSPSSSSDFSLNGFDLDPVGVGQWVANLPLEDIAEEEPELVEEEAAEQELLEEEEAGQELPEGEGAGQEWPEGEGAGQEGPEGRMRGRSGRRGGGGAGVAGGEGAGQEWPEGEGAGQESPEGDGGG
ncbi:MAG: hypothetical protein FRX48_02379 [Lasallia pustulata]|uniref:Uncharacterized protein n=1 Tax=Lasallia pustulata TaxID=136370 RepID=A0A5M8PWL8_9LECA|nr:MAG: hypothetical protein FRX48_02379 [Lasallia pustulata]